MGAGRGRLPVLAEIGGPERSEQRPWSLRRADFERLAPLRERIGPNRAVLVSGGDGVAATLAVALAGSSAACGRRTVLVECDLERPRLAAELGLAESPGVHEYLRAEASAAQVLQPLALGGEAAAAATGPLICVTAGRQAADPATLLGLGSFRHMAEKLRHAYQLLVLLGPPLGAGEGVLPALAAEADGVIVALPQSARRRATRAAGTALRQLPAPALGAVLVGAP